MSQDKNTKSHWLVTVLALIGMAMFWLARTAIKAIAWSGAKAFVLIANLRSGKADRKTGHTETGAVATNIGADKQGITSLQAGGLQQGDFKAADRIINVRLDPAVANLHLRVYNSERLVKREMIVSEPRLRTLLGDRKFGFADVSFDPTKSFDEIIDETVELAEKLINARGNMKVKREKAKAEPERKADAKPIAKEPPVKAQEPAAKAEKPAREPVRARVQEPAPTPASGKSFEPSPVAGVTFEGTLIAAGTQRQNPRGRPAYEIFEARLRMRNGVDVPFRGVELERELERMGVEVGESVSITPMGKVPTTLADGREGAKNVYRVARLDGVAR